MKTRLVEKALWLTELVEKHGIMTKPYPMLKFKILELEWYLKKVISFRGFDNVRLDEIQVKVEIC
jgi:hypothetical protein